MAGSDLLHFFGIFALVFFVFVIMGNVLFGQSISSFATFEVAVNTLFADLLGDVRFLDQLQTLTGWSYYGAMAFFWSYNIVVYFVLINFLLAIICDAFGEVKANASESVSVTTELGPMLRDSWRTTFRSFYRNHVPEDRVRRQLKIWKGENPDESDEEEHDEGPEKVIKYGDSKELDVAGLRRVLRRCVIETYQRSAESQFLLSNKSGGGVGMFRGSNSKKKREPLATAAEIEAAADMLMTQMGVEPEGAEEDDEKSEGFKFPWQR